MKNSNYHNGVVLSVMSGIENTDRLEVGQKKTNETGELKSLYKLLVLGPGVDPLWLEGVSE